MKSLRKLERRDDLQSKATYSDCKISDFAYCLQSYFIQSFCTQVSNTSQLRCSKVYSSKHKMQVLLDPFVLMSENDAIILQKSVLTMVLT